MKTQPLPKFMRGLDVLSAETELPAGAARRADDVLFDRNGGVRRRGGYELAAAALGAHSLWGGSITLLAAGATLYSVAEEEGAFALTALFAGLTPDVPVGYSEENGEVWFTQPGLVGKVLSTLAVRKPGIVDLSEVRPAVSPFANGSLAPGRYGASYSLVNDLGEESGLSDTTWLDSTGGGLIVADVKWDFGYVEYVNLYLTPPNESELRLVAKVLAGDIFFLTQADFSIVARNQFLGPLSGGRFITHYNGRTYVAVGNRLEYSDPFNPGLRQLRTGSIGFAGEITGVVPVDNGIFVGQEEQVYFLAGKGPGAFELLQASDEGMVGGSGTKAPGAMFNAKFVPTVGAVAVWLSKVGFCLGLPNGQTLAPQAERVEATFTGEANSLVTTRGGIKQVISVVKSMGLSGSAHAADTTLS